MVQREVAMGFYMQQQVEVQSKEFCKIATTKLKVAIPAGASDGDTLKFENMGEQRPGAIPGDVIVHFKQKPNNKFTRRGSNLLATLEISLSEALVGFSKSITHLDGRKVTVSSEAVSKPQSTLTLLGEGMPGGHLQVKLDVKFPTKLTPSQREQLASILSY
jgi:DnaJ-class molecular chaperone